MGYFPKAASLTILVPFPSGSKVLRITMVIPFSRAGFIDGGNSSFAPKCDISIASI
jgi:hypothetical protein